MTPRIWVESELNALYGLAITVGRDHRVSGDLRDRDHKCLPPLDDRRQGQRTGNRGRDRYSNRHRATLIAINGQLPAWECTSPASCSF